MYLLIRRSRRKLGLTVLSDTNWTDSIYGHPLSYNKTYRNCNMVQMPYDIPRYILISPTGKILHKNLSRPSNYPGLKKELDDIL